MEIKPESESARYVFERADGCSGNRYTCERCGFAWIDHIAPGCQCPAVLGSNKHVNPNPNPKHNRDTARLESILPHVGDYSVWSENELRSEIARRHLAHGVGLSSPETAQRVKDRLVEILAANDEVTAELKENRRSVSRPSRCLRQRQGNETMRVLGRGIAALIRDVAEDAGESETDKANETGNSDSHLTPPELRARIRESLTPTFFDDTATISRKIEAVTHPLRNDLTLSSFVHLRGGKLYDHDMKRMRSFRTRKDTDTK